MTSLGSTVPGTALTFAGAGSMAAAGMVLLISKPPKASAVLTQLVLPLAGVLALTRGLSG